MGSSPSARSVIDIAQSLCFWKMAASKRAVLGAILAVQVGETVT